MHTPRGASFSKREVLKSAWTSHILLEEFPGFQGKKTQKAAAWKEVSLFYLGLKLYKASMSL